MVRIRFREKNIPLFNQFKDKIQKITLKNKRGFFSQLDLVEREFTLLKSEYDVNNKGFILYKNRIIGEFIMIEG